MKEAARTSILSTKWRYLRNSIPHLDLDQSFALKKKPYELYPSWNELVNIGKWVRIVYQILLFRRAPIQSCRISITFLPKCSSDINALIIFLAKSGIQNLQLSNFGFKAHYSLPSSVFSCQSLRDRDLLYCELKLPPSFNGMSCLKTIYLHQVILTDDFIAKLVSSSLLLDSLTLDSCIGLKSLRVCAPNLVLLSISSNRPINIFLKNATSLVNASVTFSSSEISIEEATNLSLLLRDLVSATAISLCCHGSFTKTYTLRSTKTMVEQRYWERQPPFHCLIHHLQTVRINNLDFGSESALGFVRFILMHGCVLKSMTAGYLEDVERFVRFLAIPEERSRIMEQLLAVQRASSHSRLIFKPF